MFQTENVKKKQKPTESKPKNDKMVTYISALHAFLSFWVLLCTQKKEKTCAASLQMLCWIVHKKLWDFCI